MIKRLLIGIVLFLPPLAGCQTGSPALDTYLFGSPAHQAYQKSRALSEKGRHAEAEPFARQALELREAEFGPSHAEVAPSLIRLALVLKNLHRREEAEPLLKRALAIEETAHGPEHAKVATVLNNLANLYADQSRFDDAEPLYERALKIKEKAYGPNHLKVAGALGNMAILYADHGRYAQAEKLFKRTLEIREKELGKDHPDVAVSLNGIAISYDNQGRFAEAEEFYRRALEIRRKALGENHPEVTESINNLALLYDHMGRFKDAEAMFLRALEIRQKVFGPHHPRIAASLNNLAVLYRTQGRHAGVEPLLKRALDIWETALGPNHPSVANSLTNLAILYNVQGRSADAEPLFKRALEIREKAFGPNHPQVAGSLNNLAILYKDLDRDDDAEAMYKRALEIKEKALGADHPDVALGLNNLATLYAEQGRFSEAEPLLKRSLKIRGKTLSPDHPDMAQSLNNLASLYRDQGRYDAAVPLYERSVAIVKKAFGDDHPDVAQSLNSLANLYLDQDRYADALDHVRQASAIHRRRAVRTAGGYSAGALSEQKSVRYVFANHARITWMVAGNDPPLAPSLRAEGFEAAQMAKATGTAAAMAGMGARFAAGSDALARLVRARQDATERWRRADNKLIDALGLAPGKRNRATEKRLRRQMSELAGRLKDLDGRLNSEFPEYAELASPRPLSLTETQQLLGPGEAMLAYMTASNETFLWVARPESAAMLRLDIGREALADAVMTLRAGLDPSAAEVATLADIPAFDTERAFQLYGRVFAAAEPMLEGVRHLFTVPDGALQSLPLGVLVTGERPGDFTDFAGYRQVPWLARKYALTTLPSVSSLRALRRFARAARADKPFGGFGDPLLEGHPGESRGVALASLFTSRGIADVEAVRSRLAPLPDTAVELEAMAQSLGADPENLFLREDATEIRLKAAQLTDYQVLAFATHGLVAGDLKGLAEPALVLTPPAVGTAEDDGLLTAGEVAELELDADLVVLSACNTAAADGSPNAEALSGLAKAFFYAGSRSLLVSHWPVGSDAAVNLTTRMLAETAAGAGRAEALRRSMLKLMETPDKPYYAHPMFWAPFVVVGEGGIGAPSS